MKKVLLVDTNRAAYPLYKAISAIGHSVSIVGSNPNETLAKISTDYKKLDYSNIDHLDSFVKERQFDFLVPGCTDLSYSVCAEINKGKYLGIDITNTAQVINNKELFRQAASKLGLSIPRILSNTEAVCEKAVIVKPVDAFSGRGIQVLYNPTQDTLKTAITSASAFSKSGCVLLEEFVTGQLYSHSAFITNRKIVADFFVREDCYAYPYAVDISCVTDQVSEDIQYMLRKEIERLAEALCLVDGLVHTQFIANKDEKYWILEVTRRCPGDLYSLLIEFSTWYNYSDSYVSPYIGKRAVTRKSNNIKERIIRHTVTTNDGVSLWGLCFKKPVNIRLWVPLATAGDTLAPSPDGRAAIIFFRTDTPKAQELLYEELLGGTLYSFE